MSRDATAILLQSPILPTVFLLLLLSQPEKNRLEASQTFKSFIRKTQPCLDQFLLILH